MCQMSNIWHLTNQIPLFKPHEVFQMCQNFATCYSTVSNMRWYEHQCQKYFGLFNYFSLSSHQISLSPFATHLFLSLCVWFSHCRSHHATPLTTTPRHANLITPRRSHHATDHHINLCLVQRCRFVWVDVGLCRWWV